MGVALCWEGVKEVSKGSSILLGCQSPAAELGQKPPGASVVDNREGTDALSSRQVLQGSDAALPLPLPDCADDCSQAVSPQCICTQPHYMVNTLGTAAPIHCVLRYSELSLPKDVPL